MTIKLQNSLPIQLNPEMASIVRAVLFVGVALVLAVLVTRHTLVAYLVEAAPQAALTLDRQNPFALIKIADDEASRLSATGPQENRLEAFSKSAAGSTVNTGDAQSTPHSVREDSTAQLNAAVWGSVREKAVRALQRDPLNARAFQLIGQAVAAGNDQEGASKLMLAAAERSKRERVAYAWLMERAVEHKAYNEAIDYADILLRLRPEYIKPIAPVLAGIAEAPGGDAILMDHLRSGPPWRSAFLSQLPQSVTDARTPLNILLKLRDTPDPPSASDLRPYINILIQHKLYELAYYTWLQFLPPEELSKAGFLFNGSFELEPSGLLFDWTLAAGSGVTIERAPRPDQGGRRALYIEFGLGRVEFQPVTQVIMLGSGTYQLTGQHRGELVGPRGLRWSVDCVSGKALGESEMSNGIVKDWTSFAVTFTVPQQDCRAQRISLVLDARMASERFISGFIWYDDLAIAAEAARN